MTETSQTREAVVSDAVYMIQGLANCCDDGGIRDVDVLEQHEREEMSQAIRTVLAALSEAEERIKALTSEGWALIEHFERVDAPERSKAVISHACEVFASPRPALARIAGMGEPFGWLVTGEGVEDFTTLKDTAQTAARLYGFTITPLYTTPAAALARAERAEAPEGWKLVPETPTPEMCWAWANGLNPLETWSKMLAAAPAPTVKGEGE